MRFWNIGGEGQLIMGGVFASFFALFCTGWSHWALLAAMFAAGAEGGGLWGLLPAVFKSRWNTNETLFTLMLNYIALYLVSYLQAGPWRDEAANGFNKIARFDKNASLDKVFGVHFGWILMLVLVALVCLCMGLIKESLSLWAPLLLTEMLGIGAEDSLLLVVVIPLANLLGILTAGRLMRRKNDVKKTLFSLFFAAFCCSASLFLLYRVSPVASGLGIAAVSGLMYG